MTETQSFSHTGNIGDVWASIPVMNQYYKKTGKKVILYLEKDVPATYYEGATHPTKDDKGKNCMLNQKMIDMMIPLLLEQEFIEDVRTYNGEEIKFNLGDIRETNVAMPYMSINRWYFRLYPDLACDLTEKWLTVPDNDKDLAKGKVLITRTERYTNHNIDYSFLKSYEDDVIFCGTMREYNNFCMAYDLNIRKLTINNFLELAQAIKQSKFHLSNQTQAFQLSEGLMHPRILEVGIIAPNVHVFGANAFDFLTQMELEYYFNKMMGNEDQFIAKVKAEQDARLLKEKK